LLLPRNGKDKAVATHTLSWQKRLLAVGMLLALGLAFGTLLIEATARIFLPTSDFFWVWDPAIGMKLIPHKQGRSVKRGIFDVPVEINSVGFRDREHSLEKPPGTRRVVLLGDSFIEALQVPFDQSLTPMLEAKLQQTAPTELISLSVSGTGTAREYLALREYGLRYKPDLVLMFFVGNDVSDNSRRLKGLPYVPYPLTTADGSVARDNNGRPLFTSFSDQTSRLSFITSVLRDYSKGYRLVRETIDGSQGFSRLLYWFGLMSTPPETVNAPGGDYFGFYEIYRVEPKPAWAEAWRLTEEMMLATRDLARANGAQFGIVLIPTAWEVDSKAWEDILAALPAMRTTAVDRSLPARRLTNFLMANRVPVIDLLPDFLAKAKLMPPLYVPNDAHWNAEGHRLATDLLAKPVATLLDTSLADFAESTLDRLGRPRAQSEELPRSIITR
jgi:lysophospholipase L1-like esterase